MLLRRTIFHFSLGLNKFHFSLYHFLIFLSSSQGHFDDFDALAIVNSALLNAGAPVSFGMKSFLQLYSKLRNTWSTDSYISSLLRNVHSVPVLALYTFDFIWECRSTVPQQFFEHLLFVNVKMITLTGRKCYPAALFNHFSLTFIEGDNFIQVYVSLTFCYF